MHFQEIQSIAEEAWNNIRGNDPEWKDCAHTHRESTTEVARGVIEHGASVITSAFESEVGRVAASRAKAKPETESSSKLLSPREAEAIDGAVEPSGTAVGRMEEDEPDREDIEGLRREHGLDSDVLRDDRNVDAQRRIDEAATVGGGTVNVSEDARLDNSLNLPSGVGIEGDSPLDVKPRVSGDVQDTADVRVVPPDDLESLSTDRLRYYVDEMDLNVASRASKPELISAIKKALKAKAKEGKA